MTKFNTPSGEFLYELLPNDAKDIRIRFNKFLTYRREKLTHVELFDSNVEIIGLTNNFNGEVLEKLLPDTFSKRRFTHLKDILEANLIPVDNFKTALIIKEI